MILIRGDNQAPSIGMGGSPDLAQAGVGVTQNLAHPVTFGGQGCPQPAGRFVGRKDHVEVGVPDLAVTRPFHLAVIGQESDRAADPVDQGVRIAVGEVGAADVVVVVADPGDRLVVGAERGSGEQQTEGRVVEGTAGTDSPARLVAILPSFLARP